jgi:flagellar hook protein FlgE
MIGSLYTAISGLNANNKAMTTIGDNIANVSTFGFKSSNTLFTNMLNESLSGGGGDTAGAGVAVSGIKEDWTQGSMEGTGNSTDLAVSGGGFFRLLDSGSNEYYYTRNGSFDFDANDTLVSAGGLVVQGYDISGGPVSNPPAAAPVDITVDSSTHRSFSIREDGIVTGVNRTTGATEDLFQVSLYNFTNLQGLSKLGDNLYAESTASGAPVSATGGVSGMAGLGTVLSARLEMSNVDLATEFSRMIVTQKAFQANAKVITASDEILTALINAKR